MAEGPVPTLRVLNVRAAELPPPASAHAAPR
jgi:hypothetical protein